MIKEEIPETEKRKLFKKANRQVTRKIPFWKTKRNELYEKMLREWKPIERVKREKHE